MYFISTRRQNGTTCSTHGGGTFISKLLPHTPQTEDELIDVADTSRAHDLIEEGNVEGDACIQSVVGTLESQCIGKEVARDGCWDQGDRGKNGRFGRGRRRLLGRDWRKVKDGMGESVGGGQEGELVELFRRDVGWPTSEHAHGLLSVLATVLVQCWLAKTLL